MKAKVSKLITTSVNPYVCMAVGAGIVKRCVSGSITHVDIWSTSKWLSKDELEVFLEPGA